MNNNIIKEISVDPADMVQLERAYYEYYNAKDTVAYLLDTHSKEPDFIHSKQFLDYQELQIEKLRIYDNLKNQFSIKFIPTDILLSNSYRWEADFLQNKIIVSEL